MAIEKVSEDRLLVKMPSTTLKITEELGTVSQMVSEQCTYDLVIDFSRVELLNSYNISTLLALQDLLHAAGHQLILCKVNLVTKCIFTVAGLNNVFTFADNAETAFATLRDPKLPARMC